MYGGVVIVLAILFGYSSAQAAVGDFDAAPGTTTIDTTPPEAFAIALGGTQALFTGRQFLAFATSDAESGVDYYEVVEGAHAPVRSNGSYLLRNQVTSELVAVSAYDRVGNVRTAVYTTEPTALRNVAIGIVATLLVGVGVFEVSQHRTKKHA